jgi:hypothetical protein
VGDALGLDARHEPEAGSGAQGAEGAPGRGIAPPPPGAIIASECETTPGARADQGAMRTPPNASEPERWETLADITDPEDRINALSFCYDRHQFERYICEIPVFWGVDLRFQFPSIDRSFANIPMGELRRF